MHSAYSVVTRSFFFFLLLQGGQGEGRVVGI